MKLTNKQHRALKIVEWFIPGNCDWDAPTTRATSAGDFGLLVKQNDYMGVEPEEAFFMYSERGVMPDKIKDVGRLLALLWGQRYMAMQIKAYKEDLRGTISDGVPLLAIEDFKDAPEYIQELVSREVFKISFDDFSKRVYKLS